MVLTKKDITLNIKVALKSNNGDQMHKAEMRWEKFNSPTINLLDNLPTEILDIINQKKKCMEFEMMRNYDKTIEEWQGFLSKLGPGLGPGFIPACRGNEIFERKRLLLRARDKGNFHYVFHYVYHYMFNKIIELSTPELIKISRMSQNTSSEQIKTNPLPKSNYTITELRRIMKSAGVHMKTGVKKEYLYDELSKVLSKELSASL